MNSNTETVAEDPKSTDESVAKEVEASESTADKSKGTDEDSPVNSNDENGAQKPAEDDFSEFLWMENEEEFDQQVLKELEEDEMISYYYEVYEQSLQPTNNGPFNYSGSRQSGQNMYGAPNQNQDLDNITRGLSRNLNLSGIPIQQPLNPNAAEFVPRSSGGINSRP